jgi:hypothetical protein
MVAAGAAIPEHSSTHEHLRLVRPQPECADDPDEYLGQHAAIHSSLEPNPPVDYVQSWWDKDVTTYHARRCDHCQDCSRCGYRLPKRAQQQQQLAQLPPPQRFQPGDDDNDDDEYDNYEHM